MVTKAKTTTEDIAQHISRHYRLRQLVVSDNIELLEDALRPFRALEWLIRGGLSAAHTEGDLAHLERTDLAELVATLTDAAQAKLEATLTLSKNMLKE